MSSYRMQMVNPDDIGKVWHLVENDVENACKYSSNTHDADALLQQLVGVRGLLWIITNPEGEPVAHIITEVVDYPCKKVVLIVTTGGKEFKKWEDMAMDTLLEYKEYMNCDSLEAVCRPGMAKWLATIGWTKKATIMEFENGRKK